MIRVTPQVFLVGESAINHLALDAYLSYINTKWIPFKTTPPASAPSHCEQLIEVMGRLCYRSWEPGLNPNITKVREGNDVYLKNIISSGHGSVLEHAVTNWIFADISRVLTHELVRHRAGTAFSQESLRYVRLTDLGLWLPPEINDPSLVELFEKTFKSLEDLQITMAKVLDLDNIKSFDTKKKLTSAMRRAAPIGLATTIGVSFNMRALRHVIEMRTAESAEAEMRYVFDLVAQISQGRWPNIFQDFTRNDKGEWVSENKKI
jgi:thymidylate synthase (FAD)